MTDFILQAMACLAVAAPLIKYTPKFEGCAMREMTKLDDDADEARWWLNQMGDAS